MTLESVGQLSDGPLISPPWRADQPGLAGSMATSTASYTTRWDIIISIPASGSTGSAGALARQVGNRAGKAPTCLNKEEYSELLSVDKIDTEVKTYQYTYA